MFPFLWRSVFPFLLPSPFHPFVPLSLSSSFSLSFRVVSLLLYPCTIAPDTSHTQNTTFSGGKSWNHEEGKSVIEQKMEKRGNIIPLHKHTRYLTNKEKRKKKIKHKQSVKKAAKILKEKEHHEWNLSQINQQQQFPSYDLEAARHTR